MRHKSLIFYAWSAAMLASGPAQADVTVDVSVSWHDFAATAGAVDVFAPGVGDSVCLLTMSTPSSGTCTVTLPDPVAGSAVQFIGLVSLITCDQSAFLDSNNNISLAPNCGVATGGDPASDPAGAWLQFFDISDTFDVSAGESVPYSITLAPDVGPGTITGKISLPPGAQIAQGTVNSGSGDGFVTLQAIAAVSGPNADGSYGYSIPSVAGGAAPSLIFALRLPSGSEAIFPLAAPLISTPGETVSFDVATLTYVTGTVSWSSLHANSGLISVSGPANGTAPIILAPGGLSGTYDALLMADSLSYPAVSLSTCADPTFCNPGITTSFFSLDPIDTTGNSGQSISHDLPLPSHFTTLSGTVSLDGATLQGGEGLVSAFDAAAGQFTTTGFNYGPDGAFVALVGQGFGFASVVANASECAAPLNASASVDLGAAPVQQDFAIAVNTALPGSATLTVGLDALAGAAQETYDVTGTWQGDSSVAYCNPGAQFVGWHFDGPGHKALTGLLPGPWTFRNSANGSAAAGGTTFQHEFISPPQQATVPAAGTASVTFVPNPPTFTGGVDTTAWQLGTDDFSFLGAATSTNGDGSSSLSAYAASGPPPGNHLPVELLVGANEPLAPASVSAGATYRMGPTSSSSWSSNASPALPPLTANQVMPGLDALQIAGIGTWTVTNLPVPAGSQFANASFGTQAGNLALSAVADLGSSSTMRMKLPAGSYGSGPQVSVSYFDASFNFISNSYPIGGEIARGDALTDTLNSPVLLNRTPAPGTYCPTAGDGTTRINVAFTVASAVQQLQSVTIAGKPVKAGASANASVLLPLGTWPSNVSATQKSGDRTSWDRTYTVPAQMSSSAPLGTLVPHGTNPVPVPAAVKATGTATLSLQVSSCGQVVSNPNAFAKPPRIVAMSRNGQSLPLAPIAPLDADGDIDFQLGANGTWTLKLNTKALGTGNFLLTVQAPDTSLWDAMLVVRQ